MAISKATGFSGLKVAPKLVADSATITISEHDSGRIHIMPDLTADATITLPAAFAGATYEFLYSGTAADAHDWTINAAATTELFKGGVVHLDTDAGSAGDEVVPVDADAVDDDTLTVNVPFVGTHVKLVSDGSYWYVTGQVVSATAPAFS